jgi:hypothetical protein
MVDVQKKYDGIVDDLTAQPNVVRSNMFGMPVVKVNGNAFMGYFKDSMTFKLTGKAHTDALKLKGAHLFDPSGMGRPMKEWVQIPAAQAARWKKYAKLALEYVSTLPKK